MLAAEGRLAEATYRFDRIDQLLVPTVFSRCKLDNFGEIHQQLIAGGSIWGIEALRPLTGELVLNKTAMGAFGSTGIA